MPWLLESPKLFLVEGVDPAFYGSIKKVKNTNYDNFQN
jgi:hypothetical protein